jgi:putative selenium metabolism hydrolase
MIETESVDQFLKNKETQLLDFLGGMIAIKSPSAQEKEMAECVASEMKKLGYKNVHFDSVGNVIGELGEGEGSILLSAHMDTAGVADPSLWKHPPYEGKAHDGSIYGRGAGDNKGALAAMIYGAKLWSEIHPASKHKIIVGATVLEEDADGYGMQALIDELPRKPVAVMVGKPTNGSIFRGHRGRMEVRIDIKGKGCHASTPEKGDNALYRAARVLMALEELAGRLPDDPFLGRASLAVTVLQVIPGKFNMVPEEVMLCVDRRLTAGETIDSALEGIRKVMPFPDAKVSCFMYQNKAWTGKNIELEKYFPSWVVPEEHPAVAAALEAGSSAFGKKLDVGKWTVSTDGVGSMGRHGIPTIGYGPGERRVVDDHQEIGALLDAVKYYCAFCNSAGKLV